jgi:hypothetical protein
MHPRACLAATRTIALVIAAAALACRAPAGPARAAPPAAEACEPTHGGNPIVDGWYADPDM